ncbi:hypothetical protein [Actimicrobium sp. CCI2.3]|uniref:hypothetical protein n=1 Tax=Actimicrobium sp. CCI2.3 TaxID=3048616 RepID=UPI002AB34265|nr:hypothetical protein [Actimicrobium sp. CCI2.3]MDY7574746.1 hypothetical protein [Actimicrobium sp. CCI2.3]MEB0020293.1 hypothetical protein [Actimicrobium sp. CCI2.3]
MTPRHLLMTAALLMAGALLAFGDRTPSSNVAEAVARTPVAVTKPAASGTTATATGPLIVALQPRGALLVADVQAGSSAETGLFAHTDWTPLPVAPAAVKPLPAEPPPMPLTYIGKAVSDGVLEVFLASADKTYVVTAKSVIDGVYRVESIAPPLLSLTYLPMNRLQQIQIGVLD